MSDLKELIKKYVDAKAVSEIVLEEIPSRTRPGFAARVGQAKATMETVRDEYMQALYPLLFGVVLEGSQDVKEAWAKEAQKTAKCLVLDPMTVYQRLAASIEPILTHPREWNPSHYRRLLNELGDIEREINVSSISVIPWVAAGVIPIGGTAEAIKKMAENGTTKTIVLSSYLLHHLLLSALDNHVSGAVVPVLVVHDSQTVNEIFEKRKMTLKVTSADPQEVLEGLKQIKAAIKAR